MTTSAASASTSATTLHGLLGAPSTTFTTVQQHLEGLGKAERLRQVMVLGKGQQRRLWQLAEAATAVSPDDMVRGVPEGTRVIWHGRNSLVPGVRFFQKHFIRHQGQVVGLNHGWTQPFTGPGYFVCRVDEKRPNEMLIDYTKVPATAPAGWPEVVPNDKPLIGRLVYANGYDYCRKLTDDVLVSEAFFSDMRTRGQFFLLVRQ
jgi:hypothetical protein